MSLCLESRQEGEKCGKTWGEMETGPCLEEAISQSVGADVGEFAEADKMGLETDGDTGMDGEVRLVTGEMDSRVEMDTEQLACGEVVAEPGMAVDWKMDGGAETISRDANEATISPFSSAAPRQEEEERVMEEEQAGAEEREEVGMETSEDNSVQGEELTQRC